MDRNLNKQTALVAAAVTIGSAAAVLLLASSLSNEKNKKKGKWNGRPLNQMFLDYPLGVGKAKLSNGDEVTVPYHVYEGYASTVHGTCDLTAAQKVCAKESYQPVQTTNGRALGLISFWDFTETNIGPHKECQFTLLVTRRDSIDREGNIVENAPKVVADKSFATFTTMVQSDVYLLITELYNNANKAVAYNNELLGLNAIHANTNYSRNTGHFKVTSTHGKPIIIANFGSDRTTNHLGATLQMVSQFGWSNFKKLSKAPYSTAKMASRVQGSLMQHTAQALSCIKSSDIVVRSYDPSKHSIGVSKELSHTLPDIDFQGQVVFHYEGVEFCHLTPWDTTTSI